MVHAEKVARNFSLLKKITPIGAQNFSLLEKSRQPGLRLRSTSARISGGIPQNGPEYIQCKLPAKFNTPSWLVFALYQRPQLCEPDSAKLPHFRAWGPVETLA